MLPGAWTKSSQGSSHQQMRKSGSPKLDPTEQSARDWINQHRVNGWLSPEDKQQCLQEGRCFRCLEIGHRSTDCPTLRERRCASCQQMGHRARECPFENNQTSNQWFKGMEQTKSTSQLPRMQPQIQGSHRPDLGVLPMDQLRQRMLTQKPSPCAPESDHAWGRAQPSVAQEKQRCSSCQKTGCKIQDCPIRGLIMSTTPQEEERRAKDNLASIIRNIKAMPIADRLGMIDEIFKKESTAPVRIRVRQVGSIKPITQKQVCKQLWQHDATERKKIALLFKSELESWKAAPPVQIHMLQLPKKQEEPPTAQS